MGRAESPAYFCAATETGHDLIDMLLREGIELPEYPLEQFVKPTDLPKTAAQFDIEKEILGFLINGTDRTVSVAL